MGDDVVDPQIDGGEGSETLQHIPFSEDEGEAPLAALDPPGRQDLEPGPKLEVEEWAPTKKENKAKKNAKKGKRNAANDQEPDDVAASVEQVEEDVKPKGKKGKKEKEEKKGKKGKKAVIEDPPPEQETAVVTAPDVITDEVLETIEEEVKTTKGKKNKNDKKEDKKNKKGAGKKGKQKAILEDPEPTLPPSDPEATADPDSLEQRAILTPPPEIESDPSPTEARLPTEAENSSPISEEAHEPSNVPEALSEDVINLSVCYSNLIISPHDLNLPP